MWDQSQGTNTQSFSRKLQQYNTSLSLQNALGIILSIHLLHRDHWRQHGMQAQSVTVPASFSVLLFKLSFPSHFSVNQSSQTSQPSGTRGHSVGRHGIIVSKIAFKHDRLLGFTMTAEFVMEFISPLSPCFVSCYYNHVFTDSIYPAPPQKIKLMFFWIITGYLNSPTNHSCHLLSSYLPVLPLIPKMAKILQNYLCHTENHFGVLSWYYIAVQSIVSAFQAPTQMGPTVIRAQMLYSVILLPFLSASSKLPI